MSFRMRARVFGYRPRLPPEPKPQTEEPKNEMDFLVNAEKQLRLPPKPGLWDWIFFKGGKRYPYHDETRHMRYPERRFKALKKAIREYAGITALYVLVGGGLITGWVGYSYYEARVYNELTGRNISTFQAMFIQLRIVHVLGE